MIKNEPLPDGRRHGARAKAPLAVRAAKTILTFERRARVYCWTIDRGLRPVIKH